MIRKNLLAYIVITILGFFVLRTPTGINRIIKLLISALFAEYRNKV